MRILFLLLVSGLALESRASDPAGTISVKLVQIVLAEQADLALPEAGRLTEVHAREGDLFEAGDLLTRLDDQEAELTVARAEAEYAIAEVDADSDINIRFAAASEEVAKARLRRGELSHERYKNSISEAQLDEFRLAAKEAELKIEQARHDHRISRLNREIKLSELELARVQLEKKRLKAPFSGMIVQVNARPGEWVDRGVPLVRIVRLDRLKVQGFIGAEHLPAEVRGRKVTIEIPRENGSTISLESTVAFASPEINPINKQRPVWAEIENESLLLSPGMKANMTILLGNE
jgi:RND family efflux transporter MFP subunit